MITLSTANLISEERLLSLFDREAIINKLEYQPWEIRFRSRQIAWLLIYLDLLDIEQWPVNLRDISTARRKPRHAYFETSSEVKADLDIRLKATGRDGAICYLYYTKGGDEAEIARVSRCDIRDIERHIGLAMKYMSGWEHKGTSYEEFVRHKKRR